MSVSQQAQVSAVRCIRTTRYIPAIASDSKYKYIYITEFVGYMSTDHSGLFTARKTVLYASNNDMHTQETRQRTALKPYCGRSRCPSFLGKTSRTGERRLAEVSRRASRRRTSDSSPELSTSTCVCTCIDIWFCDACDICAI